MTRTCFRPILAFALLALLPACGVEVTDTPSTLPSGTGVALGGNTLHFFSPSAPDTFTSSVAVNGLDPGYVLATIDYRPATRQLYGIATNGTNGQLYRINDATGAATVVSAPGFAVAGTRFGSDFNPVTGFIRFVTDTRSNLRIDPNTGLAVEPADINLNPGSPEVHAVAYTNNSAFAIERITAQLVTIAGMGDTGTLTTVGALGITPDPAADLGFDIASSGTANAVIQVAGVPNLYTIDLATGAATPVSPAVRVGPGIPIRDLAIVP